MARTKTETHYGCASCGMKVSEDQFKAGKNTCTHKDCDQFGEKLEKMEHCAGCGDDYVKSQAAEHETCNQ
jgi:hypothetical protein